MHAVINVKSCFRKQKQYGPVAALKSSKLKVAF